MTNITNISQLPELTTLDASSNTLMFLSTDRNGNTFSYIG